MGRAAALRATDATSDPEEVLSIGATLLRKERYKEAKVAFDHALGLRPHDPRVRSYAALCTAIVDRRVRDAIEVCESALEKDFFHAGLFCNLGRVYLLAGQDTKAQDAFRRGLKVDAKDWDIIRELEKLGIRKPPLFQFLDRDHAVNIIMGRFLKRIGLG